MRNFFLGWLAVLLIGFALYQIHIGWTALWVGFIAGCIALSAKN